MIELNCDVCRNRNTYKCDACIHNEDVLLEDHFEACPETLAKLEQERIEQVQKAAIKEWIAVPTLSDAFRSIFATAKKCTAKEHFKTCFMGVFVADGELVASDTHEILVMLFADIPSELRNRVVIKLEGDKAGITTEKYPEYEHLFNLSGYVSVPIHQVEIRPPLGTDFPYRRWQVLSHGSFTAHVSKHYLDLMKDVLTGNVIVSHSIDDESLPILFTGENGRMLVMPLIIE
ncbi:hypothetical protein [Syntrophothermus lipocalidus]|uniref:Uncharacterized protein n=1 Tax=Syntrophothermus lipocalidus (strain DSM 12680 / TGB-C1) TaxID=643648 RepID=D7CPE4_SYNLT|nr:hypothetical protein [Syntrophothermus lipocalidus]ADI02579.1 hypothetical protein Slip_1824 [Syntrophothermus lipocalidus DSM 12680]